VKWRDTLIRENVGQAAFQSPCDLLKPTKRDALVAVLDRMRALKLADQSVSRIPHMPSYRVTVKLH
jgi:hypothetical protein